MSGQIYFLFFLRCKRHLLTLWPDVDKIHQRLCVECRMFHEARHRDLVLHRLNTQDCEWEIWLVFSYDLGLSCGVKAKISLIFSPEIPLACLWSTYEPHLVKCEGKWRDVEITDHFRAIIQLPDDLWRPVVGLSRAFQVDSSLRSSLCDFGQTWEELKGRRRSSYCRSFNSTETDSGAVAPTWPWGSRGCSHPTRWAPPSSLLPDGRTHSTCSCLHPRRWHQRCWRQIQSPTAFSRCSALKLHRETLRMETQYSKIQYYGSDVRECVREKVDFTLSGVWEEHDVSFWVFPFHNGLVGVRDWAE